MVARAFEPRKTKNKGIGLFAKRNIKKGETIVIARGKSYTADECKTSGLRDDHFMFVGWNKLIFVKPPACYTNHSCNPNAGIKNKVKLVAVRNIKKDEEIAIDYDTIEYEWKMKCKCGNKNCRKIIKGWKFLPKKLKKKYIKMGIVSDYLCLA